MATRPRTALAGVINIGLLVVCVITSLAAWRTERSIILLPPTLTKEVEVTRTSALASSRSPGAYFWQSCLATRRRPMPIS